MERAYPSGYPSGDEFLGVRGDVRSQYDGSDTLSITSSEDDHWGPQIGAYNENGAQYPPPPIGLVMPRDELLKTAQTVGGADMEAMLEMGFEQDRNASSTSLLPSSASRSAPRYQLSDAEPKPRFHAYTPVSRSGSPGVLAPPNHLVSPTSPTMPANGVSSAMGGEWKTHVKKRSGGRGSGEGNGGDNYGPLGPLDPGTRF